jgi:hypothetical protein
MFGIPTKAEHDENNYNKGFVWSMKYLICAKSLTDKAIAKQKALEMECDSKSFKLGVSVACDLYINIRKGE